MNSSSVINERCLLLGNMIHQVKFLNGCIEEAKSASEKEKFAAELDRVRAQWNDNQHLMSEVIVEVSKKRGREDCEQEEESESEDCEQEEESEKEEEIAATVLRNFSSPPHSPKSGLQKQQQQQPFPESSSESSSEEEQQWMSPKANKRARLTVVEKEQNDEDFFSISCCESFCTLTDDDDFTEEKMKQWFRKHNIPTTQKIGNLYTENYIALMFSDEISAYKNHVFDEELVLAYALCDASTQNFSHYAQWSDDCVQVLRFARQHLFDNGRLARYNSMLRLTGGICRSADIGNYDGGYLKSAKRLDALKACLTRAIRVLSRSECRLFAKMVSENNELWCKLRPKLSQIMCTHECEETCPYAKTLRKNGGFKNVLCSEPFDYRSELQQKAI